MTIEIKYQNPMTSLFILGTLQWEEGGNEICVTLKSIQNKMELTCYRFSWQFQPIRAVAVTESSPPRICSWVHTLSLIAAWPNRDKAQWFLKELNPMQLSPKSLVLFVRYWDMCATHWVKTPIILKSKLLLGSRNPSNNREYNPDSVEQSHIRSNLPKKSNLVNPLKSVNQFQVGARRASNDHAKTSEIFTRQSLYVLEQFRTASTSRVSRVELEADKIGSRENTSNFLAASAPSP